MEVCVMKTPYSDGDRIAIQRAVADFSMRELPKLMLWLDGAVTENGRACLCDCPPPKDASLFDVRAMELVLGARECAQKLQSCRSSVLLRGTLRTVLSCCSNLNEDEKLEAAMAIFRRSEQGYPVPESVEWRSLLERFKPGPQSTPEQKRLYSDFSLDQNAENPFYRGVCEFILEKLKDARLMK
jgi:hypothetical protein